MPMGATASDIATLYTKFSNSSGNEHKQVALELQRKLLEEEYLEKEFFEDEKYKGQSEAAILMGVSVYFFYEDQYTKSEEAGLKALALLHGVENVLTSDTYSTLGCSAQRKGNLPDALDYIQKGLAIDTKLGDRERMGSDLNTITGIYLAMEDAKSAEKYILRAIQLQRAVDAGKPSARLGIELGMASEVYLKLKKYEQALKYAKEAYDTAVKMGDKIVAAVRQCQVAAVLFDLQRYDEAEKTLREALPVLTDSKKNNSLAICYAQLADIMAVKNNDAKAEKYYRSALAICKTIGNRYLERRCEKGLAAALRTTNPVEAFKHLERYSVLADSIFSEESARQSNIFNAKYKNEELEMKNAEIEATNRAFRIILVATIVGLFLLITLAIALYVAFKHKSRAHEMAQRLEHARTSFFTNITHEFRTPLTMILGLSHDLQSSDTEDVRDKALTIERQGHGLLTLINQLLDISKLQSSVGNADWRNGNITAYLTMIVESWRDYARSRNIDLQFLAKDTVEMDFVPDYVNKVVNNLLSNAFKFTPEYGKVSVTMRCEGEQLLIDVEDTGQGMTPETLAHVFEPFYQGEGDVQSIGTGVGLALVKQIMDAVGGTVTAESTVGKGTMFHLSMPIRNEAKQRIAAALETQTPLLPETETPLADNEGEDSQCRLLVIEDNHDIAAYIGSQFSSRYAVSYASNGKDGLAKTLDLMPDLIITDLMMPGMDGLEVCRQVRSNEIINHIPVIVVTARITEKERISGLEAGADAYLAKPFNADELRTRVEKLLEGRQLLRRKYAQMMTAHQDEEEEEATQRRAADLRFLAKVSDAIYVQLNRGKDIQVSQIASAMCMSDRQFYRKINALTGNTPTVYIQRVKIKKAKGILDGDSQMSFSEIAVRCGFNDYSNFVRTFKNTYGVTPTEYRRGNAGKL